MILERFQVLKINIIQGKCFLFNTTNDLKIAPTSICKAGYQIEMENFRAISVLRSFLNMFERIICVLLFKYVTAHKTLYQKQFDFRGRLLPNNATD